MGQIDATAGRPRPAARHLLLPQPGQRGLGPARGGRRRPHVRADHRPGPALGDRTHRLRLRGPGAHRPDPQPARAVRNAGRHAAPRPARAPGGRPAQALRPGHGRCVLADRVVLTGLGYWTAAEVFLGLLAGAALLESAFGICLGCKTFAVLMRAGVVPEEVCERCNDIWATHGASA